MTALGYDQLKAYLTTNDDESRLIVTPLLDPKRQVNAGQAAIDVRLGRVFSLVRPWTQGVAESLSADVDFGFEPPLERVVVDLGQSLIIHPHQFVLARTLEIVRLPPNLLGYVIGRSSWGRRGLIVATAVVLHPNFSGPVTLELRNLGEVPIALYPLDRIAQLTFHEIGPQTTRPAERSQFDSSFEPSLGRVRDDETASRLRRMIARHQAQHPRVEPSSLGSKDLTTISADQTIEALIESSVGIPPPDSSEQA